MWRCSGDGMVVGEGRREGRRELHTVGAGVAASGLAGWSALGCRDAPHPPPLHMCSTTWCGTRVPWKGGADEGGRREADGRVHDMRRGSPELEWSVGWRGVMRRSQAGRHVLGREAISACEPRRSKRRNGKWGTRETVMSYQQSKGSCNQGWARGQHGSSSDLAREGGGVGPRPPLEGRAGYGRGHPSLCVPGW